VARVLERRIMAQPSAVPGCGPYPHSSLRWINAETTSDAERHVAACIYAALMTETCLRLLGADGPVIVEGPFAGNVTYLEALANFTGRDVEAVTGSTGTALGAGLLAGATVPEKHGRIFKPRNDAYAAYRRQWLANTV
jgi:sugar (pentulose or hexulose) kinase